MTRHNCKQDQNTKSCREIHFQFLVVYTGNRCYGAISMDTVQSRSLICKDQAPADSDYQKKFRKSSNITNGLMYKFTLPKMFQSKISKVKRAPSLISKINFEAQNFPVLPRFTEISAT